MALTRFSAAAGQVEYSTVWGGATLAINQEVRTHVSGERVVWCGSAVAGEQPNPAAPHAEALPPGFDQRTRWRCRRGGRPMAADVPKARISATTASCWPG